MRIASVGQMVYAVILIGLGILGLVKGDFTSMWDGAPDGMPVWLTKVLVYLCALVPLVCGIGLLWRRSAVQAARVFFFYALAWMVVFKLRFIVTDPLVEGSYQTNGENAVYVAGAWVLYAWLAPAWDRQKLAFITGDSGVRLAHLLYGLAMLGFGFSHFAYLELTAPLIPSWLPWHVGLAYFTGAAYIAAGAAILSGVWARLAAGLAALQMALFIPFVWLPIMASGKMTDFQWGEIAANFALVGAAWVVVDSYRGMPWLAVNKR